METLTVPLGPNCSIDGAKYVNCEATGLNEREGTIQFVTESGEILEDSASEIEDVIADEMRSGEPIRLNTGDVGDGLCIGKIEIPLVEGFYANLFILPGQGKDPEARLENLRDDELRRKSFERKIATHGGSIETVN